MVALDVELVVDTSHYLLLDRYDVEGALCFAGELLVEGHSDGLEDGLLFVGGLGRGGESTGHADWLGFGEGQEGEED